MSETPEQPQAEPTAPETAPKNTKTRLLMTIVGAIVVVFLAIPYLYTSNPESCTRCHSMQKYYDSWKKSSHATAAGNCFDCHVKQGTLSLWIYRISFYREIYASLVGADLKPVGATLPGVSSCQRGGCHSLNRVSSTSGDIKIDHKNHVQRAGIACIKCHPGAAHASEGSILPPRKMCKNCHTAQMNDCSFCHVKRNQRIEGFKHQ